MPFASLLDFIPLWGQFVIMVAVVLLSIEGGYQLGQYRLRRSEGEKEAPVCAIVGATLGLLGFILAFTFGLVATRFNSRREIVVEEANAIGTTYLRAGLLPKARKEKVRKLLEKYVDVRLEAVGAADLDRGLRRSDELHHQLWIEAEACGLEQPNSIVVGLFIQSLNETIDVHSKRVLVAVRNRLPGPIWALLYLITMLTMAGVGYHMGLAKSRRTLAILVLVVAFSAITTLIADLDRSQKGMMTVSQQAMLDLQEVMKATR